MRPIAALFALTTAATLLVATDAGANPPNSLEPGDGTELGLFVGARFFSSDSYLGYLDNAPFHLSLANSVEPGIRIAHAFFPWLVPEAEIAIAPTHTSTFDTSVFWCEPRVHFRFELQPGKKFQPFVVVGGGAPFDLSSASGRFATNLIGEGYAGGGIRVDTGKDVTFRLDARLAVMPGGTSAITTEAEVSFGVEITAGGKHRPVATTIVPIADRDHDKIPDDKDQCPDRAEDYDGFQDSDGCPDIDNDNDRVLDIADRCPNVPENYNGFEDEDGCPDTIPPDVEALRGTIEGLLYADGETVVRDSAKPTLERIAATMAKHPGIRVVLMGYTDDREAKQLAGGSGSAGGGSGGGAPDLGALSADLSRARAEAVRLELLKLRVGDGRIDVEGHGAEEPVADNATPRGRLANRRVEIKLFVPSAR